MHSVAMIAGIGRRNLLVSGQNRQPLPVYSRQGLASGLLDYQIHGGSNLPTGSECDVLLDLSAGFPLCVVERSVLLFFSRHSATPSDLLLLAVQVAGSVACIFD